MLRRSTEEERIIAEERERDGWRKKKLGGERKIVSGLSRRSGDCRIPRRGRSVTSRNDSSGREKGGRQPPNPSQSSYGGRGRHGTRP